jgi:hypothetical protein
MLKSAFSNMIVRPSSDCLAALSVCGHTLALGSSPASSKVSDKELCHLRHAAITGLGKALPFPGSGHPAAQAVSKAPSEPVAASRN